MTWLKENWKKVVLALAGVLTLGLVFVFLRRGSGNHELAAAKAEGAAEVHEEMGKQLVEAAVEAKVAATIAGEAAAVKVEAANVVASERAVETAAVEKDVTAASGSMLKLSGLVNRGDA